MGRIETDYLIIGSGAAGLAFADTLLAESDAHITIVDRHGKPGGTGTMPIPSSHCTSRRPSTACTRWRWAPAARTRRA